MLSQHDLWVRDEQLQDMRRQAERHRLARLAGKENPRRQSGWHRPALAWLGRRLADLGQQLQAQYGA